MNWTEKQLQAIRTREKNMLVSAAAGSGKTAVLVERILRLILEEKVNVDELLVVTFTKAAASEMKGKILKAIKKEMVEKPEEAEFLRKQMDNMPRASISTFHSFALDIIKRYFYVIDINPNLKIADEIQTAVMKSKAIDEVFNSNFVKENNDAFIDFLNCYSSHKNEDGIKKSILELYERIMAMPEPWVWLHNSVEKVGECNNYKETTFYKLVEKEIDNHLKLIYKLKEDIYTTLLDYGLEKMAAGQEIDLKAIEKMIDDSDDIQRVRKLLGEFKATALRASKEEKETYQDIKSLISRKKDIFTDKLKELKNDYFNQSMDEMFEQVYKTYPYMQTLEELLVQFHHEYAILKEDKKIMDFNDIEHFAIEILKNEEVANECRKKYRYIFIDEYQDSNFLQEAIIDKIKREDNLFMVGDIKQSIYRFRLAEPDIFRNRYENYKKNDDETSIKVDLNQNFRSKRYIIDGINKIFENIMDGYDDDAALYLGAKSQEGYDFEIELDLVEKANDISFEGDDKETIEDMKVAQWEAAATVKKINELVGTKYYDHKNQEIRNISYKDIVVLMRGIRGWGEVFKEIFEKNNIPVFLNSNSGYFETLEIRLITDLLKVIDNSRQDIPLLGVLKSYIFKYTVDELIKIRLFDKKGAFHEIFKKYAVDGEDEVLRNKCSATLEQLYAWKELARYTPIENFVWQVMKESGIYIYAATLVNGKQRQLNLRTFLNKTEDYSKTGDNSIYGLLKYFEKVQEKVEVGQGSLLSEEDDTVQITTIHKSKGLEYPVVIVPGLSKKFRFNTMSDMGMSHKDFGIGLTYVNLDKRVKNNTILQKMIYKYNKREELEEELRILYVAMTRAKDRLILIGNVNNIEEYIEKNSTGIFGANCFLDYIYPYKPANIREVHLDYNNLTQFLVAGDISNNGKESLRNFIETAKETEIVDMLDNLEFIYPYERELDVKSKYSVSELNSKEIYGYINRIKTPTFEKIEEQEIKGARLGTIYHIVMEHINFAEALGQDRDYFKNFLSKLVNRNILESTEAETVDIEKIKGFFKSDIGMRASKATVEKEKTFTMIYNKDGVDTIVQGIIDCYFEEDDGLVLLDYKTNYMTEGIEELYKGQMDLYKEALENATGKKVKEQWLYLFEKGEGLLL